jgi:phosphatidylglycerophosphate synthase
MDNYYSYTYDNIFDASIKKIFDKLYPLFNKIHIKPNHLTLIGFICGLLAIYNLNKNNLNYFAILWLLSIIFDIIDGDYSRKFNLSTKFGKFFDAITDYIRIIGLFILFYKLYDIKTIAKNEKIIIIILLLLTINGIFYLGCYKKKTKQIYSLSKLCVLNEKNLYKYLHYSTLFGGTTTWVIIIFLIYYFKKYRIST